MTRPPARMMVAAAWRETRYRFFMLVPIPSWPAALNFWWLVQMMRLRFEFEAAAEKE